MHCFCRERFYNALNVSKDIHEAMAFKFENGETYCEEWLPKYLIHNISDILVPLIIIVINYISKTILRIMTKFEKRQSKP